MVLFERLGKSRRRLIANAGRNPRNGVLSHPAQGLIKLRTTTLNQERRGRAGVCREHGRAAPEGHSAGVTTVGKLQDAAAGVFSERIQERN